MPRVEGNLWRYFVFQAVWMMGFFVPVIVLFWQENGLDAFDIYLLQGLFAVAVVLLEVPTGMVADRLGKRTSILCGTVIMTVAFIVYALGSGFALFLVAEILCAVGVTLLSGADAALLYDTLHRLNRQEEFNQFEGKARAIQMISFAVCNVAGGVIGEYSLRWTLWLTVIGPVLGFFLALGFVEAARQTERKQVGSYRQLVADSFKFLRKHRLVRWYVVFLAVLSGSSTWLLWLYQPYMTYTGLEIFWFGIAFAIFNLVAALASRLTHWFDQTFGQFGALVMLVLFQIFPPLLMALFVTPLSFLFILGHQTVRGISRTLISERILRYTFADKRATILSMSSVGGRLFFALSSPMVGWVAREETMEVSLLCQGGAISLCSLVLLWGYVRIPKKYFAVKDSVREHQ